MASAQEANLTSAVTQKFIKKVNDAVTDIVPLLWLLQESGRVEFSKSGREWEGRTRLRDFTPVGFDATTELEFADASQTEITTYPVRGIADGFVVYKTNQWAAGGPEQIWDEYAQKASWLGMALNQALETDLNTTGATGTRANKTVQGLPAFISTSNTYAGLSQTTFAGWAAQTQSGAGYRQDPADILLKAQRLVAQQGQSRGGGKRLTHFQTTPDDFGYLQTSFRDKQRGQADEKMLEAGHENLRVNGATVFWSPSNTANTIYGLYMPELAFWCQPPRMWMRDEEKSLSPLGTKVAIVGRFNLLCFNPQKFCLVDSTNT